MEQPKLNFGMFTKGVEKIGQDLSNEIEKVYKEVPPFAYDEETGEFLNKSSFPKLVENGTVNVQERIQSFFEDVDIYSILEKVAISGDTSLVNRKVGFYGDLSVVPDNIHDFDNYVAANAAALESLDPDLAKVILSSDSSEADIMAALDKYVLNKVNAPKAATLDDVKAAIEGLNKNVDKSEGAK